MTEESKRDVRFSQSEDLIEIPDNKLQIKEAKSKNRGVDFNQPALHYVAEKAGMGNVDKDKIQQQIIEASKGSDYYNREMKRSEEAKEKAKELLKKIELHRKNEKLWKQDQAQVKAMIAQIE